MPAASRGILLSIAVGLNAIVVVNACLHDPTVGYDSYQHLAYVSTLARGRLPQPADSAEFFSPPLPYLVPAAAMALGLDEWHAAKCAQLASVLFSIGLTWALVRTVELVWPGDEEMAIGSLAVLALFTVYFKTFALVRGEPCLAFFVVLTVLLTLRLVWIADARPRAAVAAGLALGLALLSRQWAMLVVPAIVVFVALAAGRDRARRARLFGALALVLLTAGATAGGFYLRLPREKGGLTAFNLPPAPFSLRNQPRDFYLGLGLRELFREPIRPSFANEILPTFYSDTWGDYWGFFTLVARDARTGRFLHSAANEACLTAQTAPPWCETNRPRMAAYLARVNVVALLPTVIVLAGVVLAARRLWRFAGERDPDRDTAALAFFLLVVLGSFAGYFVFLVRYTEIPRGGPIKPTYMLQVFPFLAVMAARALAEMHRRWPRAHRVVVVLLTLVWAHDLPAMITRHVP